MIYDDPSFFDAYLRSDFEQLRRFLASRNAPPELYRLAPLSRAAPGDQDTDAVLTATYAAEPFHMYRGTAWVAWPTASGPGRIRTSLSTARSTIAFAFDRPDNLRLLTDLPADTDPKRAAAMLGLDGGTLRQGVAAYDPGSYVARDSGGWAYFLVEPHGEVSVLADGPQAAPVLQMLAAANARQAQNLASRMAEFIVPIAPQDVAE